MQFTFSGISKERLDKFLHAHYPGLSRSQIQKFIEREKVAVNGKQAEIHHWLKNGDTIEGADPQPAERQPRGTTIEEPMTLEVNDDFAIIIKPAGLLIHPTEREEDDTMADWLRKKFPQIATVGDDPKRPGIVHRLDKDVSGLVLVALNQPTFEYFKGLFQEHTITKKYYCLVHGVIQPDEGQIDTPIERSRSKGRMIAQSGTGKGKHAITTFRVLKRFVNYTLLDVQILTGRSHQIRTHFFSIGHSIVGDKLYQTRDVRKKKKTSDLDKPFLFAYYLRFSDREGMSHEYTLELPEPLKLFLEKSN